MRLDSCLMPPTTRREAGPATISTEQCAALVEPAHTPPVETVRVMLPLLLEARRPSTAHLLRCHTCDRRMNHPAHPFRTCGKTRHTSEMIVRMLLRRISRGLCFSGCSETGTRDGWAIFKSAWPPRSQRRSPAFQLITWTLCRLTNFRFVACSFSTRSCS